MVTGNLKLTTTNFSLFRKLNKDMSRLTPSNAPIMHVKPVAQNLLNHIDRYISNKFEAISACQIIYFHEHN